MSAISSPGVPPPPGMILFLGVRRDYWRLLIRGAVLLMITLGIYRFWLATDVRRFLWANTEVAGEALEYTGTPFELLIGFLAAIAILIPIYGAFFVAALDLGTLGKWSGVIGFVSLAVLGQFAIYRARRYRLTRTVFRGLRFHQDGSAWRYAFCAIFWWTVSALTLGLGYPWQVASLERYKMRNTYYGDLRGRFDGSAWRLFLRGLPMWLAVVAPVAVAAVGLFEAVDWKALAATVEQGSKETSSSSDSVSPALAGVIVFGLLMAGLSATIAVFLYPVFQAVTLRWWCSGLRFGDIEFTSHLRVGPVYGAYARFVGISFLFSTALGIMAVPAALIVQYALGVGGGEASVLREIIASGLLVVGYVITALGYSAIYGATVKFSLWQIGMESLAMSNVAALEHVKATGAPSSALGEGLADALHVGGY